MNSRGKAFKDFPPRTVMANAIKVRDEEDTDMADREKIKAFVQDVLGCGCAEEVFRTIELRHETMAGKPYDRINIGNRLLVYVFRTDDQEFVSREFPGIVRAGLDERNNKGFNRFRLVLASDNSRAGTAAMKAYEALGFTDDRTFLHVVRTGQIEF
jgi:hypothetical protein